MSENSAIEWTDHTFNPWWGCEKVSPGCAHCYADTLAKRYQGPGLWGAGHRFRFFGDKHWAEPLKWNRKAEADGVRRLVFCASMADVFEERQDLDERRGRLFRLIESTPWLGWQILTKRPEFARDWLARWRMRERWEVSMPTNVWLGVSIENARFTWRADVLREIPAAVRFISAEPLLGSLFTSRQSRIDRTAVTREFYEHPIAKPLNLDGIDWVIAGGESGPGARPMHPEWAREIRDACLAVRGDVNGEPPDGCGGDLDAEPCPLRPAFFFKQWGSWAPAGFVSMLESGSRRAEVAYGSGPPRGSHSPFVTYWRGNSGKSGGRMLDGREWGEMPT